MPQLRYSSIPALLLLSLPILASGCGDAVGTVTGTVTYKDKPLPGGSITFLPKEGVAVNGTIEKDGTYRVDKVPVGEVKISIDTFASRTGASRPTTGGPPIAGGPPGGGGPPKDRGGPPKDTLPKDVDPKNFDPAAIEKERDKNVKLPEKYLDPNKSGLTFTVQKGKQTHDIPLSDK